MLFWLTFGVKLGEHQRVGGSAGEVASPALDSVHRGRVQHEALALGIISGRGLYALQIAAVGQLGDGEGSKHVHVLDVSPEQNENSLFLSVHPGLVVKS